MIYLVRNDEVKERIKSMSKMLNYLKPADKTAQSQENEYSEF